MIKNIVFDLDGTLIDSRLCISTVYKILLTELGYNVKDEILRTYIGPPIEDVLRTYVPESKIKETANRFREIYKTVDLASTNFLYDGVEQMIIDLYNHGFKLFVATTKSQLFAQKIIEIFNLDKYFVQVCASFADIGRISKTDVMNYMIETNKLNVDECILIGDTHYDAEGARDVGMKLGLVTYGFGIPKLLEGFSFAFKSSSPAETADILINNKF